VDRIKRLSYEVLDQHKSKFNENFADNKKLLDELTIIRSKGLKNEIAGYITKFIKSEKRNQEIKNARSEHLKEDVEEFPDEIQNSTGQDEETTIEIGVEDQESSEPKEITEENVE